MSERSEILLKFFKIANPELLISDMRKAKAILMDLEMKHKDIFFIDTVISIKPSIFRKYLFDIDLHDVYTSVFSKNYLINEIVQNSYFAYDNVSELIDDLSEALLKINDGEESVIRYNQCLYVGRVENGMPEGPGILVDSLGDIMCGHFVDGFLDEGIKIWNNGDVYLGGFDYYSTHPFELNGVFGFAMIFDGEIRLTDGRRFKGRFRNNVPDYGEIDWPDGKHFEGDLYLPTFYNGSLDLYEGTLEFPNGSYYIGPFVDNEFSGEGLFETTNERYEGLFEDSNFVEGHIYMMDGCEYEGECDDYSPHGHGTWHLNKWYKLYFPNGDSIEGEFEHGLLKNGSKLINLHELNDIDWIELKRMLLFEDIFQYNAAIDDEGVYHGEMLHGLPNGRGTLHRYDGTEITGYFTDGEPDGCVEIQYENGESYYGEVEYFKLEGRGKYSFDYENYYTGDFLNNKPHGKGTMELDYSIFTGEFVNGEPITGYLKSPYYDNTYYSGEFIEYTPHGKGEITTIYGKFRGNFTNGNADGDCSYKSNKYEVYFKFEDGEMKNPIYCFYSDGREYNGDIEELYVDAYESDLMIYEDLFSPNGYGIMYYPDGIIDEGVFVDGIIRDGIRIYPNGEQYSGIFDEDGNIPRVLSLENGEYEGDVKNGLPDGIGTLNLKNGDVYKGSFTKGKYDGPGTIYYKNGDRFEGEFVNGAAVKGVMKRRK